jgi:spore coat polysaccharide biosynthesis protein SpsF (cytidylyltransferase family)
MKPLIVVQARLGSNRLPGKVVMSIGDRTMLEAVYTRATIARQPGTIADRPFVAVPREDEWLFEHCGVNGWAPNVPEDDVLARFFYATTVIDDPIVRITADCPLIDPAVIQRALDEYDGTALVCSTQGPNYATGYPDGQDVEVFSREMLEEAFAKTPEQVFDSAGLDLRSYPNPQREHVTAWMRENCSTHYLDHTPPVKCKLSVDTWDDLQFVRRIVEDLGSDCTLEQIYDWVGCAIGEMRWNDAREERKQTRKP